MDLIKSYNYNTHKIIFKLKFNYNHLTINSLTQK